MERIEEIEPKDPPLKDESLKSVLETEYSEPAIYRKRDESLRTSIEAVMLCITLIAVISLAALKVLGII